MLLDFFNCVSAMFRWQVGTVDPSKRSFSTWHRPCRIDLADRLGMIFVCIVGTVVAGRQLQNAVLRWGLLSPGLLTPPQKGLTACTVVYTLDLAGKSRQYYFLVV